MDCCRFFHESEGKHESLQIIFNYIIRIAGKMKNNFRVKRNVVP